MTKRTDKETVELMIVIGLLLLLSGIILYTNDKLNKKQEQDQSNIDRWLYEDTNCWKVQAPDYSKHIICPNETNENSTATINVTVH